MAELQELLASRDTRIGELESERSAVAAVEQASTPPAGVSVAELDELRQRARVLEAVRLVFYAHEISLWSFLSSSNMLQFS